MIENSDSITVASIAQALASDYFSIYYVNTETDRFIEYSSTEDYQDLGIEKGGEDFFNLSRKNIQRVIYPADREMVLEAFTKENILAALAVRPTFTLTYRLLFGDEPTYVNMKATRMRDRSDSHIVIGVSNIDAQMKAQEAYEKAKSQTLTFSRIAQALAEDYFSIYYVDAETDRFIEYSSHATYDELNIEKGGEDFFNLSRKNVLRVMHPDDQASFLSFFTKENVIRTLEESGTFTLTYRLLFDGVPTYVNMKAPRLREPDGDHIVIGVNNIDAQMRREKEYSRNLNAAREKANRDSLTGVKSKHAYVEAEEQFNQKILAGQAEPFSVIVCDVNGLKQINDTLGHKAGDQLILAACRTICNVFKHSPVFRVGGDEFVVISHGQDEEQLDALMAQFHALNLSSRGTDAPVIACGMARFDAARDANVSSVFERADAEMYENKKALKAL